MCDILLLEKDESVAKYIVTELESKNYNFKTVCDTYSKFTQSVSHSEANIIVLTSEFPQLFQIFNYIKDKNLKAFFLVYIDDPKQKAYFEEFNADITYIYKPLNSEQLIASIEYIINNKISNNSNNSDNQYNLVQSDSIFKNIWEYSFDGMRLIDKEGTIQMVNNAFCKLVDKTPYELIGKHFSVIYNENTTDFVINLSKEYTSKNKINEIIERDFVLWNGKNISFQISNSRIMNNLEENILSIFRDVTTIKENQANMQKRGEFEMLIITISTSFLYYKREQIISGIEYSLKILAEYFNINRCFFMLSTYNNAPLYIEYNDLDENEASRLYQFSEEELQKHCQNGIMQYSESFTNITNKEFLESIEKMGITFLIVIPLIHENTVKGFIGLESYKHSEYILNEIEINLLQIMSDIIILNIMRLNTEHQLAEDKEDLNAILNSLGEGVISTDKDGNIVFISNAARSILEIDELDMVGISDYTLWKRLNTTYNMKSITDISKEKFNALRLKLLRSSVIENIEIFTQSSKKIIAVTISPIFDSENSIKGYVLIIRDDTQRIRIQEQLSISQKMESVGQLAAGIAHEINTPIQYINDNNTFFRDAFDAIIKYQNEIEKKFELVEENNSQLNKIKEYLNEAKKEADIDFLLEEVPLAISQTQSGIDRVKNIILAMKDFAHASNKQKTLSDINKGIITTVTISRNEWKYVADIEFQLSETLPLVSCVLDEINQVFLNMIVNASHAIEEKFADTDKKGQILISTRVDGNYVVISIQDNGKGIPKENISRIYDPFFTTKPVGKGTGQGLSIAHDIIVNKHNGKIFLDSEVGKGTTFSIHLPTNNE